MATALDGIRVLDFSRVLAGPFATMVLADLGAEVTKVERPGAGDETRAWGPPYDESGASTYFLSVNRNKTSIALDLREPSDLDRARALARETDVLVENFRPGVMERFGLGHEELTRESPRLNYCSITAFGRGRGASLPGYDLLVQAMGGLMSITGAPNGEPQKVGVALVDVLAGLFASVGIMAALRHRELSGEGQHIEVDLLSSLLAALVNQGSAYTVAGVVPSRMGNAHPSIAPYELFRAADGDLVLAVGNDRQFLSLCDVLGHPELARDHRFAGNPERVTNREELRKAISRLLAGHPVRQLVRELTQRGVPAGVVNDVHAAFELAAELGLGPIVELAREDAPPLRLTRNPIGLSKTPPRYATPPPSLP